MALIGLRVVEGGGEYGRAIPQQSQTSGLRRPMEGRRIMSGCVLVQRPLVRRRISAYRELQATVLC